MKRLEKIDYKSRFKLTYDPDDVNIRLQHFRVSDLIQMINKKSILKEDFFLLDEIEKEFNDNRQPNLFEDEYIDVLGDDGLQRNSELWNSTQKSQFIESLMIKLPIPLFYFDGSEKPWRIIDGLQRLHTIVSFVENKFKLTGLEYLHNECDDDSFTTLPGYLRARVMDAEIIAYVINPGTPPDVKYNIFKRINTGGLKLNSQEIRNSFFRGTPANFTKSLANEPIFKAATNNKVTFRRMADREYANRFIAFQVFDYNDFNGKMDTFLSEAMMDLYDRDDTEFLNIHTSFKKSLQRAHELFDGYAFYRPKPNGDWGRQPNKALFDTFSWNLNELPDYQFDQLINNKEEFKKEYFLFMNQNEAMYKSINDTTGSKTAVLNRFNLLKNFLTEFNR